MSRIKTFAVSLLLISTCTHTAVMAEKQVKSVGVKAEAKVMASPEITYQAIRSLRAEDPSGCRELSKNDDETIVEEVFDGLPVIGKATCVYRETYEPLKSVSFRMLRSDKLKAFEGEWTLQSIDNGKHTLVSLRSYIDTGIKVPFIRQITDMASLGEVKGQVADLKHSAELKQNKVAGRNKDQTL